MIGIPGAERVRYGVKGAMKGECKHMSTDSNKRWTVVITLKGGVTPTVHRIEELSELQALVEHGPPFNEIAAITIAYNRAQSGSVR
jgi:hypothetical protein